MAFPSSPAPLSGTHGTGPAPAPAPSAVGLRVREVELDPADPPQRHREKLARIVLDEMYQFVALLDPQGTLLEVNRAALEGAGIRLDAIQDKPFWEARWWTVSQETQQQLRRAVERAAAGEFVRYDVEVYGQAAGEETIVIDFSLNPVRDRDGRIVFLLPEGRNITEKKKAEAEIARKNEELQGLLARVRELDEIKSQLFANISHELRTPLALILGPAETMLAGREPITPLQRRDLGVIRRNASTLLKLVNDLLDVAKLDAGKMELRYVRLDAAGFARSVASHFEALAASRGIAFVVDAQGPVEAELDPEKLERVLLNLLSNAFKFTPEGGRVKLRVAAEDEGLRISVQDSGPGVPAAARQAIFERFRQAEGGTTRRFGGTGLGLAITRDFVQLHGGSIAVADAPGSGALFIVHLPLHAPEGTEVRSGLRDADREESPSLAGTLEELLPARPAQAPGAARAGRPNVLVAEDNPELNRFITECLGEDFNVATAFDGQEALEKLLESPPDLLVTDIMMPRLSGDGLVAELRRRRHLDAVPVLVLSAKADDALRNRLLREGAQDYVTKPFSAEELRARARNLSAVKLAREVLQAEVASQQQDLAQLARDAAGQYRARGAALAEASLARDAARAASEAKSQFLRLVSHELRTPLQTMQFQTGMLRRQLAKSDDARHDALLGRLEGAARRMAELVDMLLEAVRAEAGQVQVAPSDFDADALLRELVQEMRPRVQGRPLALRYEGEALPAHTDPSLLRIVATNLIDNALKYTERGEVAVVLRDEGEALRLEVSDTGPGIAAEHHARIFEPFEQLGEIRHKHLPGVGLGLAISRRVVEALGGSLSLESAPGQGSRFSARIPRRFAAPPSARAGDRP
ncbi:ATP-binding protein [Caldimonas tepidiphila]|uniref:ATP-binding protein n=1 Tax=Caldimonas tepidiphila TaxID=2315841 RepID=UPI0014767F2A|nr:ATP-binding protein [Caldimonas tepidiphila]